MVEPERAIDSRPVSPKATQRALFLGAYAALGLLGYVLGSRGAFPVGLVPTHFELSPAARVGVAFEREPLPSDARAFAMLQDDLDALREALPPEERGVFELVVAVRGLEHEGHPDWARAAELCKALQWPRCDQEALAELARRSRP